MPEAVDEERVVRIRQLNDDFRTKFKGDGVVCLTIAVKAFHSTNKVIEAVQEFDDFNVENDPFREHDFGAVDVCGERFWWKIDYYDKQLVAASPDPSDESKTKRVMTIMRPEDY